MSSLTAIAHATSMMVLGATSLFGQVAPTGIRSAAVSAVFASGARSLATAAP